MNYDFQKKNESNIHQNIVDFLKIKTFSWYQYLVKNKEINDNNINFNRIYVSCNEAMEKIKQQNLDINFMNQSNLIRIILDYNDILFVYKISIEYNKKIDKKEKIEPNFTSDIINKKYFLYPVTFYFINKIKETEQTLNKISLERVYCNVKSLFGSLKKIELIDKEEYKIIKAKASSPFHNYTLNNKTITLTDITFYYFYHPDLCTLETIRGFEYHIANNTTIKNNDLRLFAVNTK